jgi:hypothetical protein
VIFTTVGTVSKASSFLSVSPLTTNRRSALKRRAVEATRQNRRPIQAWSTKIPSVRRAFFCAVLKFFSTFLFQWLATFCTVKVVLEDIL